LQVQPNRSALEARVLDNTVLVEVVEAQIIARVSVAPIKAKLIITDSALAKNLVLPIGAFT
jgi:hypothetical protein